MSQFGQTLRRLRVERKLTQHQLAVAAGCVGQQISNYETGRVIPELQTLIKLADALQVRLDTFRS